MILWHVEDKWKLYAYVDEHWHFSIEGWFRFPISNFDANIQNTIVCDRFFPSILDSFPTFVP